MWPAVLVLLAVLPPSFSQLNLKSNVSDLSTLRYLAVITRHGSRSPIYFYPNDPYPANNSTFWPDGYGELTKYGKQQLYVTGQTLRNRYNDFLNLNYNPNDTLIRANRYNRDYMSAATLLAGLYPPVSYQVWNPEILWQPIPIWEEPFDAADLMDGIIDCKRYQEDQEKADEELNKLSGNYTKLFQYLSKNTGSNITNITDILLIWDVLEMQSENGYKLPPWAESVFPEKMERLFAVAFATKASGTSSMISLGAGPVLKKINDQLMEKAQGKMDPNRLLYIEAAHDTTLQALLSGLGFEDPFRIKTSAFMVFELHESSAAGHTVQILYYNSSAHTQPNILDPPNCPRPCSLSTFSELATSLAPPDFEAACSAQADDDDSLIRYYEHL